MINFFASLNKKIIPNKQNKKNLFSFYYITYKYYHFNTTFPKSIILYASHLIESYFY